MVRAAWILLFILVGVYGGTRELLPWSVYIKNRAIVKAVAQKEKDLVGRLDLLEQAGVIQEALKVPGAKRVRFVSSGGGLLLLHLAPGALQKAGIFDYYIDAVTSLGGKGVKETVVFEAQVAPKLSRLVKFFRDHGARVVGMRFSNGWNIRLDMSRARLVAERVRGSASLRVPKEGLWLEVCGAATLKVRSGLGKWYPKVTFYDRKLHALGRHQTDSPVHSISLSLPNGACYIKIADRFTHKNLRRGVRVTVR